MTSGAPVDVGKVVVGLAFGIMLRVVRVVVYEAVIVGEAYALVGVAPAVALCRVSPVSVVPIVPTEHGEQIVVVIVPVVSA